MVQYGEVIAYVLVGVIALMGLDAVRYRISQGEALDIRGPGGLELVRVPPGQGILWSTGPDRVDHGGRRHGGEAPEDDPRYAFLGVRGCDLRAIAVQDRVLGGADGGYARRRRELFIVAVSCTEPADTCFCASTGCGPAAGPGYDLGLTELVDGDRVRYLVEVGTPAGLELLTQLPTEPAPVDLVEEAAAAVAAAATKMSRALPEGDLRDLLAGSHDAARWDDVAARCLSCGNCTMVCPTCFCTTVEDVTDVAGEHAERWLRWDSCFDLDFSYLHGGPVRTSTRSRYRQWLTHKLGTWHDQFGESGCVGCGRCIAWCPVGIDITEETRALVTEAEEA